MENRTRPYAYTFRASENERKIIDEKLKASSLTMTDFIIKSITNKPIMIFENSGEILNELKRQGNNLNQLARANYCGLTTKRDILSCVDELKNTYKATMLLNLTKRQNDSGKGRDITKENITI